MTDLPPLTPSALAGLKAKAKATLQFPPSVYREVSYRHASDPETILRLIDMVERQRDCLLLSLEDYGNGIPRTESRYREVIREALAATEPK